jgi:hypothetical protein
MLVSSMQDFNDIWKGKAKIVRVDTLYAGNDKVFRVVYYPPK